MRLISETTVRDWAKQNPQAASGLEAWIAVAKAMDWQSLVDVRRTFPNADAVTVASGSTVAVFNIAGNKYRLITALHYNRGMAYTLRFMTHAEYSKDKWKSQL